MTELAENLERLGLGQYIDAFISEGFDTWETLLDVQESDLEQLGVKLGHRRKLQRAIADYRGISYERLVGSPTGQEGPSDPTRPGEGSQGNTVGKESSATPSVETKRKYRRHPKADENAPDKPPSAYVLFSNKIREEVKAENLSFTEIAKLVGDRWQKLDPSQKEPFESQASSLKEKYNIQLSAYKKTDAYKEYMQYLADFKTKHGPPTEPKRPKLDPQSSGGSLSATSVEIIDAVPAPSIHGRVGSMSSIGTMSYSNTIPSPQGSTMSTVSSLPGIAGPAGRALPSIHRSSSPQAPQYRQPPLLRAQISTQSSASDDSTHIQYDALSRTATLSLNTPPAGTPPLPSHAQGSTRLEQSTPAIESHVWPPRIGSGPHQLGSTTPSGPSPLGSGIHLPSPTFPADAWRDRGLDWVRQLPTTTTSIPAPGGHGPTLPFPNLIPPDRLPDLAQSQVQRTLPPLRNSMSGSSSAMYQSPTSTMQVVPFRQTAIDDERRHAKSVEGAGRQLDRNENEAANTLAGLAARPGSSTPQLRNFDRDRA